jgi:hypothetical protein
LRCSPLSREDEYAALAAEFREEALDDIGADPERFSVPQ